MITALNKDLNLRVIKDLESGKVNLVSYSFGDPFSSLGQVLYFKSINKEDAPSSTTWGYPYLMTHKDNLKIERDKCDIQIEEASIESLMLRNNQVDDKIVLMPLDFKTLFKNPEFRGNDLSVGWSYDLIKENIKGWEDMGNIQQFLPEKVYDSIINIVKGYNSPEFKNAFSLFYKILPDLQQIIRDKISGKEFVMTKELSEKLNTLRSASENSNKISIEYLEKVREEHEKAVERGEMPF